MPALTNAVLDGFGQLDQHPDAIEAFEILRSADVDIAIVVTGRRRQGMRSYKVQASPHSAGALGLQQEPSWRDIEVWRFCS